jgi:hypothetical protein
MYATDHLDRTRTTPSAGGELETTQGFAISAKAETELVHVECVPQPKVRRIAPQ